MDLDIIQSTKEGEITQFLCDVRDYFKASLATSEYENTSNMFYLTASEATELLLNRCECLLNRLNNTSSQLPINTNTTNANKSSPLQQPKQTKNHQWHSFSENDKKNMKISIDVERSDNTVNSEEVSYLDMSASHYDNEKRKTSNGKCVDLNAFRCSTFVVKQNKSFLHRLHDTMAITATKTDDQANAVEEKSENEDDTQIYDICQVTSQESDCEEDEMGLEETQKAIARNSQFSLPNIDCPYMDLPAGHLPIKTSIKYGQLMKIEKRLFFDQSKKCYCGILNDWLLCYADGPTSSRPTVSLYLKIPGIEIEHFGEGKRREICFQITTCDPNKRFVFQAINEIDAKEWIHAIEAAIRSDITGVEVKNSSTRKLPTPPVMKKITFLNSFQGGTELLSSIPAYDGIYEEPSHISQVPEKSSTEIRPTLPHKQNNPTELSQKFEYDVPKSPPQPFKDTLENEVVLINPYESNQIDAREQNLNTALSDSPSLTSSLSPAQKLNLKMDESLDFQAKVKDVHSKLTSQLSSGPIIKLSHKKSLSSTSQNDAEHLSLPSPTSSLPEALELKKQKKSSNPNSPQKLSNEKSLFAKNWFLNRINKNTSSPRSNSTSPSSSPSKCKQSEKENLLKSSSEACEGYDLHASNLSSNPVTPASKTPPSSGKSKVNMIINKLEASGHLASMFNLDAVTSFSAFSDNDFNNYEPIMTVATTPTNLMKKI